MAHNIRIIVDLWIFVYVFNCSIHCTPVVDIWNDTESQLSPNLNLNLTRNPKVLNFFPIPVEEECNANDGRRKGVCMNPYECRMQSGTSRGTCALGFGVCCVFTATCDQDVYNNITYFVNPNFPDLTREMETCTLKIKKIAPEIVQLKLDFVHFNLGQPNRRTGVCEEDVFVMTGGNSHELTLCGINSGHHVFYDVDDIDDAIIISMNMSRKTVSRLWEIRITQIPFAQRAPEGCLQYHTGTKGVLQTMNFAENGRHLANQDYNICMRQEDGMCSIAYEPCDDNSFKIGNIKPHIQYFNNNQQVNNNDGNPTTGNDNENDTNNNDDQITQEDDQEQIDSEVGSGDGYSSANLITNGNDEVSLQSRMMEICTDRILLPCDNDDLLLPTGMPTSTQNGYCSLAHCGSSLCPDDEKPCRVESNVLPFTVGVQFGGFGREESPEDNLGICLTYEQQPCLV